MGGSALYAYGVVEQEDIEFETSGVDGAGRAYTVDYRTLSALVTDVDTLEPEQTDENARAHDEVLQQLLEYDGGRTVVPMRFGMVFKDEGTLKNVLRETRPAFRRALRDLDGTIELGLKVLTAEDADAETADDPVGEATQATTETEAITETQATTDGGGRDTDGPDGGGSDGSGPDGGGSDGSGPGGGGSDGSGPDQEAVREEVAERFDALAKSTSDGELFSDRLLVNRSFLVDRDDREAFDEAVGEFQEEHDDLLVQYTGPWAPYNFVDIEVGAQR